VVECDICGETISAANDEELAARVRDHLESQHDQEPDDEQIATMLEEEAYDATDS
jgi:predicted small metal-binding protein